MCLLKPFFFGVPYERDRVLAANRHHAHNVLGWGWVATKFDTKKSGSWWKIKQVKINTLPYHPPLLQRHGARLYVFVSKFVPACRWSIPLEHTHTHTHSKPGRHREGGQIFM